MRANWDWTFGGEGNLDEISSCGGCCQIGASQVQLRDNPSVFSKADWSLVERATHAASSRHVWKQEEW